MNLLKKDLLNLRTSKKNNLDNLIKELRKKKNLDNLIYKYKTEGRSSKDFSVYQNPINLFTKLSTKKSN